MAYFVLGSAISGDDIDESYLDLLVDPTPQTTLLTLAATQLEAEHLFGYTRGGAYAEESKDLSRSGAPRSDSRMKPRHPQRVPQYLQHILDAIDRATGYVSAMTLCVILIFHGS